MFHFKIDARQYNAENIWSIRKFRKYISSLDEQQINKEFIGQNISKAIEELKIFNGKTDDKLKKIELLKLVLNLLIKCERFENGDNVVSGFQEISKITVSTQTNQENCFDIKILVNFFDCLNEFTKYCSDQILNNCLTSNFLEYSTRLLKMMLSSNKRLEKPYFDLYYLITSLLFNYINKVKAIKSQLVDVNVFSNILDVLETTNNHVDAFYLKINLMLLIYEIESENKFQTVLKLSLGKIVSALICGLKNSISHSKINKKPFKDTKNYSFFKVNKRKVYWTAENWLDRLISIAVDDKIKETLFENNQTIVFNLVDELIKNGNKGEIKKSCELILLLCFNRSAKNHLRNNRDFVSVIENASYNANADTKRICNQIIDLLNRTPKLASDLIMISYSRKFQKQCLEINETLKTRGHETWIDTENEFNISVSDVIDHSSVLLICYSEEYQRSGLCRYEAEYAIKLKKKIISVNMEPSYKPSGWLELLIKTNDVDLTLSESKKLCDSLIEHIKSVKVDSESQTEKGFLVSDNVIDDPKNWDCNKVRNWLIENNLIFLSKAFSSYNGLALKGLYQVQQKDYTLFIHLVQKQIDEAIIRVTELEKLCFYALLADQFKQLTA